MILVNLRCWDTASAPGPKINAKIQFDVFPREGEQIEVDLDRAGIPEGIYYVHKVRHVYQPTGKMAAVVEITDRR